MNNFLKAILFAIIFVFSGVVSASDEHKHPDNHVPVKGSAGHFTGKKYESDAPLRTHMSAIRTEMQSKIGDIHSGRVKDEDYQRLSEKIDTSIQSIFKDCKLKPEADAALHTILTEIMAGSAAMKTGPKTEARPQGFLKVIKGLDSYGQMFNHAGWKPMTH
ncbi:MAG: hypothetical protein KBD78_16505 [Oligoflexales bacterium]|jgi:hypothetical protein|nr:hypothetical protein [Oligoflexales bacterium]